MIPGGLRKYCSKNLLQKHLIEELLQVEPILYTIIIEALGYKAVRGLSRPMMLLKEILE